MVRAILDGRKTQTRRALIPQPTISGNGWHSLPQYGCSSEAAFREGAPILVSRYGAPGDRLWVRETWQHSNHPLGPYEPACDVFYRADYLDDPLGPDLEKSVDGIRRQWRPSIHMPRSASRITLEVTGVRVERLQEISDEDACAEGGPLDATWPCDWYRDLWNSLNAARGYGWSANPWVWVVEFKRIEQ
jgi:hypothetical protein